MTALHRIALCLCLVGPPAAALRAQVAGEPVFAAGDLASLTCKVVEARPAGEPFQLLVVEVSNLDATAAEPLEFVIELADKKPNPPRTETFARVQLPAVQRFGRPAPAGGKQSYFVPTALPGKKAQFAVRVGSASFYTGGEVAKPDLKIGDPTQVQRTSLAGTFPVTQVTLHNPFERDLDVLLLVTLKQPVDAVELMGARLTARGKLDWVVTSRGGNRTYLDPEGVPGCAIKATAFQVVDWSLLGAPAPGAGAELLRPAYEAWYRWPEAEPQVAGEFTYRERRQKVNAPDAYEDFVLQGRFTVSREGKIGVEIRTGQGANPQSALASALENLRRPDFATLAAKNTLAMVTADRVAVRGPGWDWNQSARNLGAGAGAGAAPSWDDLQVQGGRIASNGIGDGPRTAWVTRAWGGGYVVARRHDASTDTQYSYGEQDGRIVPTAVTSTTTFGDKPYSAWELVLSGLRFEGVAPIGPQPPKGEGAAALRAIWDAPFRLPTAPIAIEAQFEVTTPGTDLLWRGQKKLRGKVVMQGIGRHMQSAEFGFVGDLSYATRLSLAAVVRDRLLMWYGRDFNDRPPFDEFFRGAVIRAPNAANDFPIENCHVERVFTEGGLVRGWQWPGGSTTKFTWQKFGDVQAVVRVDETLGGSESRSQERWNSSVQITLAKVGDHLLPTGFVFERIFGRDWGPESIVLKNLTLR